MGLDEVWIASLFYGQAAASARRPNNCLACWISHGDCRALQGYPTKAAWIPVLPTDPLIYRFYETHAGVRLAVSKM